VGWTSYGPHAGPSSRSTETALGASGSASGPEYAERPIEEYWRKRDAFRQEHANLLEVKAKELLSGKQTAIQTSEGTVQAKLTRFRNGAVLEHWQTFPGGSGHGMMRVERQHLPNLVPLIVDYLAQTVLGQGPHARPLR